MTKLDMDTVSSHQFLENENDIGWQQLLAPAPMGIGIMSQLMVCASRITDIRIDQKPGRLMRHPESFRTSLVQIGNDVYTVFMKAHSNMEQIQIQMAQVPGYVQESSKILQSGNQNAIDKILPLRLKRIRDAADDGEKLSKEVANSFDQLAELISQVLDATSVSISFQIQQIEVQKRLEMEQQKRREMAAKELELKNAAEEKKGNHDTEKSFTAATSNFVSMLLSPLVAALTSIGVTLGILSPKDQQNLNTNKGESDTIEAELEKINEKYVKKQENVHVNAMQDINRDKAIEFLTQELGFLKELEDKWSRMASFFQRVKNDINKSDVKLIDYMTNLIPKTKLASELAHQTAKMYLDVSNRYIVTNVASMQRMLTLKDNEVDEAQQKLMIACKEATQVIWTKVKEDNE